MLQRVQKIRERDYLFIDTLDQHYGVFHNQLKRPYNDWRRFNYEQVVELRDQLDRTIAGEQTLYRLMDGFLAQLDAHDGTGLR